VVETNGDAPVQKANGVINSVAKRAFGSQLDHVKDNLSRLKWKLRHLAE